MCRRELIFVFCGSCLIACVLCVLRVLCLIRGEVNRGLRAKSRNTKLVYSSSVIHDMRIFKISSKARNPFWCIGKQKKREQLYRSRSSREEKRVYAGRKGTQNRIDTGQ